MNRTVFGGLSAVSFAAPIRREVARVWATDNPDLSAFRKGGGKPILWHGWSDPGVMPEGTVDYYEKVSKGDFKKTGGFARLFMAPGVGHCAGGAGPQQCVTTKAVYRPN